jgi:hypothetical protein
MPPTRNQKPKGKKSKRVRPYTKVVNPVSVGSIQKATQPKIQATAKSCRIRHRELMDLIDMSAAFESRTYRINPGVGSTFPWLSGQAQGWEQYKFHSLALRYVPTCSTTEPGVIVMFVDYDPTDSPPTTVRDAMTNATATAGPVRNGSTVVTNTIALLGGLKAKYIETQLSASSDLRSTDSGNFIIATEGGNNIQVGAIWIEYDVEFMYPQRATPAAYSHAIGFDAAATTTEPFGLVAGQKIPTLGHLIHDVVGYYPDGTVAAGTPNRVVTLKNLVAGARYLINTYVNTTGSAAPTQLFSALGLEGVVQAVDTLVEPTLSGTGFKAASFTWRAPEWITSATKAWVSVVDTGTVFPDAARVSIERIPETIPSLAFI